MKAVIFVHGGLVQEVISSEPLQYLVIDKDTESYDEDELTHMTDPAGNRFQVALTECFAGEGVAEPDMVEHYFKQIPPL